MRIGKVRPVLGSLCSIVNARLQRVCRDQPREDRPQPLMLLHRKVGPLHVGPCLFDTGLEVLWLVGHSGAGQDMAPELVGAEHAVVGLGGGAAGKLGLTGAAHVRTALLWPADCAASTGLAASSDIDGIY